MRIETNILCNLINNEKYSRKVTPFIKPEYFSLRPEKIVLEEIFKFFTLYNKQPNASVLKVEVSHRNDVTESVLSESLELIDSISLPDNVENEWLLTQTEKFCKDKAIYNAIYESIYIMDGKDEKSSPDTIPQILSDALGVSFDTRVGHDYIDNAEERFEFYNKTENKIPFKLDIFNKITDGGLPNKTLSCVIAGTGGGKSLFMTDFAAWVLSIGKNVLYITMEMSEEKIAERIDANLLNVNIKEIKHLDSSQFKSKIDKAAAKTSGKLIIREYPTGSAHAGHFRALLQELKIKRNFVPDLIVIDYLNICASQRMKLGGSVNSYTYVKHIAEELRALAVYYDLPILTATQTNREGLASTDIEMGNTSESIGLPATLDFYFALMRSEELDELGQIQVKQLKNRYNDPNYYKRFVIGVDYNKMKLFDVEMSAQEDLVDKGSHSEKEDKPLYDTSKNNKFQNKTKFSF